MGKITNYIVLLILLVLPVQASLIKEVNITDASSGVTAGVDGLGHLDVIAHGHEEGGHFHAATGSITASTDYIIVDISDTTNYPHSNTTYLHLGWLKIGVDANSSADYEIQVGFVTNVDATNGDFYDVLTEIGSKTAGRSKFSFFSMHPEGQRMRTESIVTSHSSLNDTAFQTDVNMRTTLSPGSTATPPGNGDIVMRITVTAGAIDVTISGAYHSH